MGGSGWQGTPYKYNGFALEKGQSKEKQIKLSRNQATRCFFFSLKMEIGLSTLLSKHSDFVKLKISSPGLVKLFRLTLAHKF